MLRKQLFTTGSIVLGCLVHGGHFQEFSGRASLLTSDPRIRLFSPDGESTWLEYPEGYDTAIAAKWDTRRGPEYQLLYHPIEGWIDPWMATS